jgi:hypothetical protein
MRSAFRRKSYSLNDTRPFLDRKNLKRLQQIVRAFPDHSARISPVSRPHPADKPSSQGGNHRFTRQPAVIFRQEA